MGYNTEENYWFKILLFYVTGPALFKKLVNSFPKSTSEFHVPSNEIPSADHDNISTCRVGLETNGFKMAGIRCLKMARRYA